MAKAPNKPVQLLGQSATETLQELAADVASAMIADCTGTIVVANMSDALEEIVGRASSKDLEDILRVTRQVHKFGFVRIGIGQPLFGMTKGTIDPLIKARDIFQMIQCRPTAVSDRGIHRMLGSFVAGITVSNL